MFQTTSPALVCRVSFNSDLLNMDMNPRRFSVVSASCGEFKDYANVKKTMGLD
jgi:hypothetical protein